MMLPILISVSLAPVSYFFCASAPLIASKAAISRNIMRNRRMISARCRD